MPSLGSCEITRYEFPNLLTSYPVPYRLRLGYQNWEAKSLSMSTENSLKETAIKRTNSEHSMKLLILVGTRGWSELTPTNAPVADEPVEVVFRMNENPILPTRIFFFSTSSLPQNFPPSYLPPPTYHLPTPPPSLHRQSSRDIERERAWSGWSQTHARPR
jgi:hypothetical protein